MTLLDAATFDKTKQKARVRLWLGLAFAGLAIAIAAYLSWNLPAEHRINQFFAAVESQNFPEAFGIWNNDADWQQHAARYASAAYPYGRFLTDWGSGSEYGTITHHRIVHATSRYGNTTMVVVEINGRAANLLTLAVQKHDKVLTFPPFSLTPADNGFGWKVWQINFH